MERGDVSEASCIQRRRHDDVDQHVDHRMGWDVCDISCRCWESVWVWCDGAELTLTMLCWVGWRVCVVEEK